MSLTDTQKTIVQTTFAQVTDTDALAARFYARLFEIDPSTRPLFKGDMAVQRQQLIQMLSVVVNALDHIEQIVPAIQQLGQRHATYGVTIAHWDSVGEALIWTLAETFGEAFTDDVAIAWTVAYALIAQTAIAASYPAAHSSSE